MSEVLVDVAAAAARVMGKAATPASVPVEAPAVPAADGMETCPLGHQQEAGARFCHDCGLSMNETPVGARVDLDALREALPPREMLSAEAKAAQDRQHMEALAANARMENEVVDIAVQPDPSKQKVRVHFVEDGFTWAGRVWNRGDEIELGPDHPRWESALGWIRLTKVEQFNRYGRVYFDFGPYPGRGMAAGAEIPLATAGTARWSEMRGGVPARPDPESNGSLIPW